MDKFQSLILGNTDLPTYAAYFVFALIGAIISLYIKSQKRDKLSENTPYNFSLRFLFQDNLLRIVVGILLAFLAFRFGTEFVGSEVTVLSAVFIGGTTDRLAGLFQNIQDNARK
ncbi:hypothetical protein DBR40_05215 [Pedobacter sp. KBW01]|uniref:hypothetical protein n=1 Tax=Pedobacter sp. KBW01 TaxID=2153364 RepID=UPI000F5A1378|nr:hypothetical protein [Pedobacter sp. KBW01]RQO79120.1 hypothetical protein DBR40_05215 [Pedobacter sp. KBW01]